MTHRTIIIPASAQANAQALCKGLAGAAGDGMFVVGLSASGEAPATHYISSGTISAEMAALLPCKSVTLDKDGKEQRQKARIVAVAGDYFRARAGGGTGVTVELAGTERVIGPGAAIGRGSVIGPNTVIGAGFHAARAQAGGSRTKNGNFEYERSTGVSLSVTARMPDGTSSGYFLRNHFDIAKLDTKRIAAEAVRKALEGQGAKVIDPGNYTVILEPQAVADLLGGLCTNAVPRPVWAGTAVPARSGSPDLAAAGPGSSPSPHTRCAGSPRCSRPRCRWPNRWRAGTTSAGTAAATPMAWWASRSRWPHA